MDALDRLARRTKRVRLRSSILARLAFDAVLNGLQGIVFTKVLRGYRFWFSGFKLET
jgi:hypothetical protein